MGDGDRGAASSGGGGSSSMHCAGVSLQAASAGGANTKPGGSEKFAKLLCSSGAAEAKNAYLRFAGYFFGGGRVHVSSWLVAKQLFIIIVRSPSELLLEGKETRGEAGGCKVAG